MLSPKSGALLLLSQEGTSREAGGQGSPRNLHSVTVLSFSDRSWQHGSSMLFPDMNSVILCSLMLLVGRQDWHPTLKVGFHSNSQKFNFGDRPNPE